LKINLIKFLNFSACPVKSYFTGVIPTKAGTYPSSPSPLRGEGRVRVKHFISADTLITKEEVGIQTNR